MRVYVICTYVRDYCMCLYILVLNICMYVLCRLEIRNSVIYDTYVRILVKIYYYYCTDMYYTDYSTVVTKPTV